MPNGATNTIKIKVANLCSIIATKGYAFYERASEKDAYDIYWLFKNHPKGDKGIIQELSKMKHNKLVSESLGFIKERFKNLDSLGPVAVSGFLEPIDDEEKEILIRDAYETINRIIKYL